MACAKHVQERQFTGGLESAILHAADGVRRQRLGVEAGRLGECQPGDDGLHASGVAIPVYGDRGIIRGPCVKQLRGVPERSKDVPASPAQMST